MNITGIFAKEPIPGTTKTRLGATIGHEAATNLYEAFVLDLLSDFGQTSEQLLVGYTPATPSAERWFSERAGDSVIVRPQPDTSLGHRIEWFFDEAFQAGATKAVLIGSDSPDLPAKLIDEAFEQLDENDIVLAPATDGGFVLVGLSKPQPSLFASIRWSSPSTLLDTIAVSENRGLCLKILEPWYDIDTIENLGTLLALQQTSGPRARKCPQTYAKLQSLWPQISKSLDDAT